MRYLSLACILLFSWQTLGHANATERRPLPTATSITAAQQLVEELYKKDYIAAKTVAQKRGLAKRLLDDAAQTSDDPAAKFAMLQVAKKIAIGLADVELASQVAERIAAEYEVSLASERAEILKAAAASAKTAGDNLAMMPHLQRTIERLTKANEYTSAQELAALALAAAKKTGDSDLVKQWTRSKEQLTANAKLFDGLIPAKETLKSAPTDPAANGTVGKVLCFLQEDWDQGLPHLALGDDEELQLLAERELKRDMDRAKLADDWTKVAMSLPEAMQVGGLRRAEKWYREAIISSDGLAKRALEKRVEQLLARTSPFAKNEWVDLLSYVEPARHAINATVKRDGDSIVIEEHHDHGYFTIPVTATGAYEIRVRAIRLTPKEQGLLLRLPGTRGALYSFNAFDGAFSGLTLLNGKDCNENASRLPGVPFREQEPYVVQVRVEPRGESVAITTAINGRKYSRWAGPMAAMATPSHMNWKPDQFGVDVWWSKMAVQSFELKVLDGVAYVTE